MAACTAGALLVALELARLGAILSAGAVLLVSVGLALCSRHWFVLARRSRVGARSEDEVQRLSIRFAARAGGCVIPCAGKDAAISTR